MNQYLRALRCELKTEELLWSFPLRILFTRLFNMVEFKKYQARADLQ